MALGIGALLVASLASALVGAYSNHKNIEAQKEANDQNVKLQQETNAQNQYNIEHAHQIEMADLEAAGLNPVLTATGGSGAPISNLQAPNVKPVQTDLSGVGSSLSSAINSMTMMMMANSMAKTNQSLLLQREAGKNQRLGQVLAARTAETHAANSASRSLSEKRRLAAKRALEALDDGEFNWDFLDDPPDKW